MPKLLNNDSPEIVAFLQAWPAPYGHKVRAVTRSKYIAIDHDNGPDSWCGYFLVDRVTRQVFRIKAYGVKGSLCGMLEAMTADYHRAMLETTPGDYKYPKTFSAPRR